MIRIMQKDREKLMGLRVTTGTSRRTKEALYHFENISNLMSPLIFFYSDRNYHSEESSFTDYHRKGFLQSESLEEIIYASTPIHI